MIAMTIMIVFAVAYVKEPEGLLQLIVSASRNPESAGSSPWSTMHLWFLYYLLMFSLIAVVVCHWKWLKLDGLFRRTWLLVLTPLALVPGVIGGGAPVAAPESFIPTWWPFLFYGLFYFAGWQLVGREELLDRIQTGFWPLVILGAVLYVPYYQLLPVLDVNLIQQGKYPLTGALYLVECVLTAYLSATWTIIALLAGQRFLSASNPWLKFFADSSYWVYLIHLPVIIFLQTLLIPAEIPVWGKLLFVLVASWLFCSATYVVFVRYTPVGWMLNGKRISLRRSFSGRCENAISAGGRFARRLAFCAGVDRPNDSRLCPLALPHRFVAGHKRFVARHRVKLRVVARELPYQSVWQFVGQQIA